MFPGNSLHACETGMDKSLNGAKYFAWPTPCCGRIAGPPIDLMIVTRGPLSIAQWPDYELTLHPFHKQAYYFTYNMQLR